MLDVLALDELLLDALDEAASGYVPPLESLPSPPLLIVPLVTAGATVLCTAPPVGLLLEPMFGVVVIMGAPVLFAPEQPATASMTRTTRVINARYFFKKASLRATLVIVPLLYSSTGD